MQIAQVHNIPVYDGSSFAWADSNCRDVGDVLSGNFRRRNMGYGTISQQTAAMKTWIVYSCTLESAPF